MKIIKNTNNKFNKKQSSKEMALEIVFLSLDLYSYLKDIANVANYFDSLRKSSEINKDEIGEDIQKSVDKKINKRKRTDEQHAEKCLSLCWKVIDFYSGLVRGRNQAVPNLNLTDIGDVIDYFNASWPKINTIRVGHQHGEKVIKFTLRSILINSKQLVNEIDCKTDDFFKQQSFRK